MTGLGRGAGGPLARTYEPGDANAARASGVHADTLTPEHRGRTNTGTPAELASPGARP